MTKPPLGGGGRSSSSSGCGRGGVVLVLLLVADVSSGLLADLPQPVSPASFWNILTLSSLTEALPGMGVSTGLWVKADFLGFLMVRCCNQIERPYTTLQYPFQPLSVPLIVRNPPDEALLLWPPQLAP